MIPLGNYIAAPSALHRLDPRTKVAAAGCLTVLCCLAAGGADWLLLGVVLAAASLWAGMRARFLLRSLQAVMPVAITTMIFQAFVVAGPAIFSSFPWMSWPGLERGGVFAARMICAALVFQLLAATTSPVRMCDALESLLSPFGRLGLPVRELSLVASISLRFVPILGQEADVLAKAQIARGACLDQGSLWKRMRAFFSVLVPLLVRTFRYADDLAVAMEARGYSQDSPRTRLYPLRFGGRDALAGLLLVGLAVLMWSLARWS